MTPGWSDLLIEGTGTLFWIGLAYFNPCWQYFSTAFCIYLLCLFVCTRSFQVCQSSSCFWEALLRFGDWVDLCITVEPGCSIFFFHQSHPPDIFCGILQLTFRSILRYLHAYGFVFVCSKNTNQYAGLKDVLWCSSWFSLRLTGAVCSFCLFRFHLFILISLYP